MKRPIFIISSIATLAIAAPAMACEMHGGGYTGGAFGMNWQSYTPRASYTDPAQANEDFLGISTEENYTPLPKKPKTKPSFSSAASDAAQRARSRLTKNSETKSAKPVNNKPPTVQKASLDSNR